MAKKSILLPYDLYKGLVSTRNHDEDLKEVNPLQYEKGELEKIKRKRMKDLSAKKELYQQQLRRYLRTRQKTMDKPLKVQLGDDIKLLLKTQGQNTKFGKLKAAVMDENGDAQEVKVEQKLPGVWFSEAEEGWASANDSTEDEKPSVSTLGKKSSETPKRQRRNIYDNTENIAKREALLNIFQKNPEKFGLSKKGEILNPKTSKPILRSNLNWILDRLISPSPRNAPSPVGMNFLKKKILEDEEARKLIHQSYIQTGKGRFRPVIWKK